MSPGSPFPCRQLNLAVYRERIASHHVMQVVRVDRRLAPCEVRQPEVRWADAQIPVRRCRIGKTVFRPKVGQQIAHSTISRSAISA
jgi:hypothetical protein